MEKGGQDLAAYAKESLNVFKQYNQKEGWVKQNGKDIFEMKIDERIAIKAITTINFSLEDIFNFLNQQFVIEKISDFPKLVEKKILTKNEDYLVQYTQLDAPWPSSNREYIKINSNEKEENKIHMVSRSCNYNYPENKKVVRAWSYIFGYILEKVDDKKTKMTFITDADMKGSMPGFLKNMISSKRGQWPTLIQAAMKKNGY